MNHYHVRMGDYGYLPNVNDVYTNKSDARRTAEWYLNDVIETLWQTGGSLTPKRRERISSTWTRSLKANESVNLTEVKVGAEYVEWEACEDVACLEHTHRCSRNGWHSWVCRKRVCFGSTRMSDGIILEWECKEHVS